MRKISERGLFGVLVMIISMLAVQMSAFAFNTYENSTQIKAQLQLDAEDEAVLNQYFQNRAENFYGNTVVDGWMKEEQLQRIAALSQWMENCGFNVEKATNDCIQWIRDWRVYWQRMRMKPLYLDLNGIH